MKYLNFKPQDKGWSSRDEWFFAHINTVLVQIFETRIFREFIISEFSQFHFQRSRDSVNNHVCRSTIKAKFSCALPVNIHKTAKFKCLKHCMSTVMHPATYVHLKIDHKTEHC